MANYSEAMKAAWAKKSPEERSEHARRLARHRWDTSNKKTMEEEKVVETPALEEEPVEEGAA